MKALALVAFGVSLIVANLAGRGSADPPPPLAAVPGAEPAAAGTADDCHGGEGDALTVTLEPDQILRGRAGERMAIGIHVHPHFEGAAAIVGAVEIIDDRGRRIGDPRNLAARALAARTSTAYQVTTPDQLADGYYRVQVSVLARATGPAGIAGTEDFSTHQLYFQITDGAVLPVTTETWLTRSESGLAFTAP